MTRTLAVLITYFGERELLAECLDSLLSAPLPPDEVLVYDDASPDPAEQYVPPGTPVRVIRALENGGPAAGRNALLAASSCDYVHFHDADDLFHQNWSREVRFVIGARAPDIVLTEITSVRGSTIVSRQVLGLDRLQEIGDLVRFALRGSLLIPSTTFRRTLGVAIGGFRSRELLRQSEDFDFHIRLAAAASSWEVVDQSLVIQRLRAGSHSADHVQVWSSATKAIQLLVDDLPGEYRQELSEAAARVGSRLFELHARPEARLAFRLARTLGRPRFLHRSREYRLTARILGPEIAEWTGRLLQALRRLRRVICHEMQ